jgi:predicted nucleic acid-binding protein
MRVIVSDTSPIRYLVLIGEDYLLGKLYGGILIPDAVANELQTDRTPEAVRKWMQAPPSWVTIVPTNPSLESQPVSFALDAGERQVLLLALDIHADLILMDERAGVEEARRLGLAVTGTLGVLARCADHGWIDLGSAVDRLQQTNFRVHPQIIQDLLRADAKKKQT